MKKAPLLLQATRQRDTHARRMKHWGARETAGQEAEWTAFLFSGIFLMTWEMGKRRATRPGDAQQNKKEISKEGRYHKKC